MTQNPKLPEPVVAGVRRPPQFSIRFLLLLTTLVAAITALAVAFGTPALPPLVGLTWTGLNCWGKLAYFQQSKRAQSAWILAAWVVFLISLALPAVDVFADMYGWQAAWTVACIDFSATCALFGISLESNNVDSPWLAILLYTPMNLGNLILILAPILVWPLRHRGQRAVMNTVAICTGVIWPYFLFANDPDVLYGFYVWCLAFAIFFSAHRLSWRIWWGMLAVMVAFEILFLFEPKF